MPLFATTIAGSLPKPAWLAEPNRLWAPWRAAGAALADAKRDATLLALKLQEDCGIDIVTDGEQSRQHFVHGFLEFVDGIDFARKVEIGIRADRYKAMVLADLLNAEARALEADGVDVIQFDEPAFNVYLREVEEWGIDALHRAIEGLTCTTAVHICYGYGIKANIDWKATLGKEWRQYERIFPALAKSRIGQVSVECRNSRVPIGLLKLLDGKDVQVGAIDVATDEVETPDEIAAVIGEAAKYVA